MNPMLEDNTGYGIFLKANRILSSLIPSRSSLESVKPTITDRLGQWTLIHLFNIKSPMISSRQVIPIFFLIY